MNILFDNTYAQLPERFFAKQESARVPEPKLIRLNLGLAAKLAIDTDWLKSGDGVAMLAGLGWTALRTPGGPARWLALVAGACSSSGSTRVSPMVVMKLVSPSQRGSPCM